MSLLRDTLNDLIATSEKQRGMEYPRIGEGHAEQLGGIFSLLRDPGGKYTTGAGSIHSKVVDLHNDDDTAGWSLKLINRLGIQKSIITPWNAFGAYHEKLTKKSLEINKELCQTLIDTAKPSVIIAQGKWAQRMMVRIRFNRPVYHVPHPSKLGLISYKGAGDDIEAAFKDAYISTQIRLHYSEPSRFS